MITKNHFLLRNEIEHFKKTNIPRCQICHTDFIKIKGEEKDSWGVWKPACKCHSKNIRLSVG